MTMEEKPALSRFTSFCASLVVGAVGVFIFIPPAVLSHTGVARNFFALDASSGLNGAPIFSADKGKFRILVNGQQAGKEEFEISTSGDDWVAHGSSEIQSAQGVSHVTGTLTLRPDGDPVRYEWATQGAKKASATITFTGATANIELRLEGARPYSQQFTFDSPRVAVLDNNLYHQYAVLGRLYDWDKKGPQKFSVLVPQELTPGTITVLSVGKQEIAGAKLEQLLVKTEDLELNLYFDGARLMRIVVPSANAEIIRE
jgi:hypothetical protein